MKLKEIFSGADSGGVPGGVEVSGLAVDSRSVKPGDLFFAIAGAHTDGHLYIADAIARGARAVVTERDCEGYGSERLPFIKVKDIHAALAVCVNAFYNCPSARLEMVGITGTNGKTTTSYLLESVWSLAGRRPGVIGTINYRINGETVSGSVNTTPHALLLQQLLNSMAEGGSQSALMEVSSHSLALKRVDGILFDAAVFTNLTRDHLDFHSTPDEYFLAKRKLFEMLSSRENPKKNRLAVLNGDDARCAQIRQTLSRDVQVYTCGLGEKNDFRAENIVPRLEGVDFTLAAPEGKFDVSLKLWGPYNARNALSAVACARGRGIAMETALEGVCALERVPGRMEAVREGQDFHVFVDFAHTDSALNEVLTALSGFPHGRIYTVFGCGGERDRGKRGPMGTAACSKSAHAFITADNPRREPLERIFGDIESGLTAAGLSNYTVIPDRKEAVFKAIASARKGDIVLLAGKGHETVQILHDGPVSYSDYETARQALKALK